MSESEINNLKHKIRDLEEKIQKTKKMLSGYDDELQEIKAIMRARRI